jgi:hypothetical protein
MSVIKHDIAAVIIRTAGLVAQLGELNKLRDLVREAETARGEADKAGLARRQSGKNGLLSSPRKRSCPIRQDLFPLQPAFENPHDRTSNSTLSSSDSEAAG